jgi:hypothetical protein
MKNILIATVIGLSVLGTGCATLTNWWDQFQSNPAEVVSAFESVEETVLADVSVAWSTVQPLIPAANVTAVTADYETALTAVNHAVAALNAALQAAATAQTPSPDFTALMGDVTTAVGQVIAIVDQFGGNVTAPVAGVVHLAAPAPQATLAIAQSALADAHAGLTVLKGWHSGH